MNISSPINAILYLNSIFYYKNSLNFKNRLHIINNINKNSFDSFLVSISKIFILKKYNINSFLILCTISLFCYSCFLLNIKWCFYFYSIKNGIYFFLL